HTIRADGISRALLQVRPEKAGGRTRGGYRARPRHPGRCDAGGSATVLPLASSGFERDSWHAHARQGGVQRHHTRQAAAAREIAGDPKETRLGEKFLRLVSAANDQTASEH